MPRLPRLPLHPASGTGTYVPGRAVSIRFVRHGCANRPFFHIVVTGQIRDQKKPPIEQLGTYDRSTNESGEKLVSLNLDRIAYWVGKGASISRPVAELFGLAGLYPIHYISYVTAWRNRRKAEEERKKLDDMESAKEASVSA